ncbi:hypothetical protein GCM10012275_30700 [Longimycelium tulufanense]|uniref:Uncharacterized protein n=1 Tax=Longimycelium tulufanense TaxID=907463 RepID=A0A8J3CF45_9PSEU|nr:hypothetical protein GCM10012275_30700 [Longimycelium tulufanense]
MVTQAPTRGTPRVLRGATLAFTSAILAGTGHAAAGGGLPDAELTAVLTVALAGISIALADRRRGFGVILLTLGGSQVVLHTLLQVFSGHVHHTAPRFDSLQMAAGHAVAALITAVLLTGAESAIFAVVAALSRLLPVWRTPPPATAPPRWCSIPGRPARTFLGVLLRRVCGRRGPPTSS